MKKFKGKVEAVEAPGEFIPVPEFKPKKLNTVKDILLSLQKSDGTPLVSKDEANNLVNLTFPETDEKILSMEYKYFLYEIISMLNDPNVGYQGVFNFLSVDWIKIFGRKNIRTKMIFENPLLESSKLKLEVNMDIYRNKIDVVKGAVDCSKCKSSETISVEK